MRWGVAAAALFAVAVCISSGFGFVFGIPLLDGLAPPAAYRWVRPPPELRSGNKAPAAASARITLTATGSPPADIGTPDDQVMLSLPAGAFAPVPGQVGLAIAVQPLDAAAAPAPPPGTAIQGNAYRIAVTYTPSGATATAVQPVDVTLRYPVDATQVILLTASGWQFLPTTPESSALAVDATTKEFGVFAAASTGIPPATARRTPPWAYLAAGLALLAAATPTLLGRRRAGSHRPVVGPVVGMVTGLAVAAVLGGKGRLSSGAG